MTEREKIIACALEVGVSETCYVNMFSAHADNLIAFYELAQKEAFEQAVEVCETDGIGTKYQGDVYATAIRQLIKE